MAMLFPLGMWMLYLWLARKCLRMSAGGLNAQRRNDSNYWGSRPDAKIPQTVPSHWVETYRAVEDR